MSEGKHTLTPWKATKNMLDSYTIHTHDTPHMDNVIGSVDKLEDAEFVCKSSSSHDQLVEALKKCLTWYFCPCCGVFSDLLGYEKHNDHTCPNCTETILQPVSVVSKSVRDDALKAAGEDRR